MAHYLKRMSSLAAISVLMLLAACGSSSGAATETASSEGAAIEETAPAAATAPVVAPTAVAAEGPADPSDDIDQDDVDQDADDHDAVDQDADDQDTDDHDADDHDHSEDTTDADGSDAVEADASTAEAPMADTEIANASFLGSYALIEESFGTMVTVTVNGTTRTIESNTLPNHDTGDFPNSGNPNAISAQDRTWELTTEPTYTGQARTTRETGVALNGVKFEPGTAESVTCSTGESYRIEGLQETFDLGMDFNNAHVQPTGEYHYHGVSEMLVDAFDSDADLVLVGFGADGHLIYYSKSNAYLPSYTLATDARTGSDCDYRTGAVDLEGTTPDGTYVSDWVYSDGAGDLDECNGVQIGDEYAYVITEQYPYISRCLMGEFTEAGPGAGGGGRAGQRGAGGGPDLSDAAAALGVSVPELQTLLGGPPPDFAAAAAALGIPEDELRAVLTANGAGPPNNN